MTTEAHVITVCSLERREHVLHQIEGVHRWMPRAVHHTVLIGREKFDLEGSRTLDHTGPGPVNLAAARNAGAQAAVSDGAGILIFLDADCIPGPDLEFHYRRALGERPHTIACGPVTYLPEPIGHGAFTLSDLPEATAPHAARPDPAHGETRSATADEYLLFWSLSFAVTTTLWQAIRRRFGGFCEDYSGYGGEDTDFAMLLRHHDMSMVWVGGAHAYHQWHPVSSPPVEHLESIMRNADLFHQRWGWWPMRGWLEAFIDLGLIDPPWP